MGKVFSLFKSYNERYIRKHMKTVDHIVGLEKEIAQLTNEELSAKTIEFKEALAKGVTMESILPEAFAVCREASWRVLSLKHFPVQILGGIVLHQGKIAEMKTGEGKTLVVTLPAYLNALSGNKVHIVTVNEYLAKRDKEQMGQVFEFLGLTTGITLSEMSSAEKKAEYEKDIVYGTNSEFGFDYLRDHMARSIEQKVQQGLDFCIVDEVDSILIDEARTPLIITSSKESSPDSFYKASEFVKQLGSDAYVFDERDRLVYLTENGITQAERYFGITNLSDIENHDLSRHINQALKARFLLLRDRDYIVKGGKVILVDAHTGRLAAGKVYSDGLHQAIEAKEGLSLHPQTITEATISYQNYFRLYKKLAGMTGTAITEEEEFRVIYGLETIVIPTNKPMIRKDLSDVVYKTIPEKLNAIIQDIKDCYERQQPVLVGTSDIEKSEKISSMLTEIGIPHQVLNAKHHEREAQIISQAGRLGAVTIATNMAGRGTDIILGGGDPEEREKVVALGGLKVIGTERHNARRIDDQLKGRSGRQGDPGVTQFYLALDDPLLRLFGGEQVQRLAETLKFTEGAPLEARLLDVIIRKSQKTLEGINFQSRKNLLEYDNILDKQRSKIYDDRDKLLAATHAQLLETIRDMSSAVGGDLEVDKLDPEVIRMSILYAVDTSWVEHLGDLATLREGIGLHSYAGRSPLEVYSVESHRLYEEMLLRIKNRAVFVCQQALKEAENDI